MNREGEREKRREIESRVERGERREREGERGDREREVKTGREERGTEIVTSQKLASKICRNKRKVIKSAIKPSGQLK